MKQIEKYQVEDIPLGAGGMGKVLKGTDPEGRPVAIKEILPQFVSDMEYRTRIDAETAILRQMNHPGIVKIYDYFPKGNNLYIVMEYVDGQNIEQYIEQHGAMAPVEAVQYMRKILDAMQHVHEQGIIHRDVKPQNIMIRDNGEICILDFGVAKDQQSESTHTVVGTVIGTDGYMSPEQANGFAINHLSDIYSLGCVFYFMLTGHHAFSNLGSEHETYSAIVSKPFPRLDKYVKGLPSVLQKILDDVTDKDMRRRYQSCREFSNVLQHILPGTHISKTSSTNPVISVGREGCDIIIDDPLQKVSRHHADITMRQFTGGTFYVYTDCSSNGTVINGNQLTRGMSENIPANGPAPTIMLAGLPSCVLNWADVMAMMQQKIGQGGETETTVTSSGTTMQLPNGGLADGIKSGDDGRGLKFLLGLISFLSPLIALILYNVWKNSNTPRASHCARWGWIGFWVGIASSVIMCIVSVGMLASH